jgi:hypothetical protein
MLCCAAWLEFTGRFDMNTPAIWSNIPVLTGKATWLVFPVLLLCLFLTDCGGSGGGPTVSTIAVTSAQSSIAVSGTDSFSATAKDQNGNVMSGVAFAWASSASNVAEIDASSGAVIGLLPGTTQVTASAGGVTSNAASLTVTPGFLATGSMSMARSDATATLLNNGMVLIAGGMASGSYLSEAELYNPVSGTFTVTGSMTTARELQSAILLNNGMVLIVGGYNSSGFLSGAELYNPASGTFTATGSLSTPRRFAATILLQNGTVLVAGGAGATDPLVALASAEIYDPVAGTFTPTGDMNVARRLTTGTLLDNGMVLIAGGANTDLVLGSAELYNPASGTFTLTGNLNTERGYYAARLLNTGMVLIAGGETFSGSSVVALASVELYDPAHGTFTAIGNMNAARVDPTATLLNNGTVLFTGGWTISGTAQVPLSSAEVYDPVAAAFAMTGSLNSVRATQTATLLPNGTVLVVGGLDADGSVASAEYYEPGTLTPPGLTSITVSAAPATTPATPTISPGTYQRFIAAGTFAGGNQQLHAVTWSSSDPGTVQISNDAQNPGAAVAVGSPATVEPITLTASAGTISGAATLNVRPTGFVTTGSMKVAREDFTATVLNNGMVLVADGDGSGAPAAAELYNPATGTFSVTGTPLFPRFFGTATLLENGMVLIAGGSFAGNPLSSAELYNPATGIFSATGSLNSGRYFHAATLLNNGTVLITGGQTSSTSYLASAELYNPATGQFTVTGSLNIARGQLTATRLDDGTVLIAGGQGAGGPFVGSAEIYDPASGSFAVSASLNTPRVFHTATLLPNGTVLIAGGVASSSSASASAELYNPAGGGFTTTGNLTTARADHTATLLGDGLVLLSGGLALAPAGPTASAELYNPATGSFAATGSLKVARAVHVAALLGNGTVLIAGGAGGVILSSAELY